MKLLLKNLNIYNIKAQVVIKTEDLEVEVVTEARFSVGLAHCEVIKFYLRALINLLF